MQGTRGEIEGVEEGEADEKEEKKMRIRRKRGESRRGPRNK